MQRLPVGLKYVDAPKGHLGGANMRLIAFAAAAFVASSPVAAQEWKEGGLVVLPDTFTILHRAPIISAAARNNIPAVYIASDFVRDGGLLSYGPDPVDNFRRAATFVDRILRGAKAGDLPVQFPVKYEMVVNLKTAKALGLTVPQSILLRADEVTE
jgi:putative ABC transport system substrate-binding protein